MPHAVLPLIGLSGRPLESYAPPVFSLELAETPVRTAIAETG